ncbi:hypothetical protein [Amycolatopsis magusensis]|uniref:hypothetical protein n=1 Tax=Amycolatopsis magusensis TaxID=882444 RepID=UPI0037AE7BED
MHKLLAAAATALAASLLPVASASAAPEASARDTFYCAAATTWTFCSSSSSDPNPRIWRFGTPVSAHVLVNNHAAGGERCRIVVDGGTYDTRTIAPTYHLWTWLGNTGDEPAISLECVRAAASGDAGIGGYIQFNY